MDNSRIGYMDVFRGLCLCWIIWIHTEHPAFLDYPLHLPALFFISGCFFKFYPWPVFWRKKVNRLVIPFVFFYLLYYVFLVSLNFLSGAYVLSILCHFLYRYKATSALRFIGENALIVFGLHDMYLTICRIITLSFVSETTYFSGFLNLLLVLLLMWPSVLLLKKYFPHCVGRKPVLALP